MQNFALSQSLYNTRIILSSFNRLLLEGILKFAKQGTV